MRHKFGTKDTYDLLLDQVKVHDTLSSIQNSGIIKKVDRTHSDSIEHSSMEKSVGLTKNEDYYDLGNFLRHAICHGYPSIHERGTTSFDYNPDINKKYLADRSNISHHRKRKDWLG